MADLAYVTLTVAVIALVALLGRGAERHER